MLKKNYSKTGAKCRVTFDLQPGVNAEKVSLCGSFNNWNPDSNPMKKRKNGRWSTTISLESGRKYRFKYLIDGQQWENDWNADSYEKNQFGTEDSIIKL